MSGLRSTITGLARGVGATLQNMSRDVWSEDRLRVLLEECDVVAFNLHRPAGKFELKGIKLEGRDLRGVNLEDAVLDRAGLNRVNLTGAQLARASLVGANLSDAIISEANVQGANLERADLTLVTALNTDFTRAIMPAVVLRQAAIRGATLCNARMPRAVMHEVRAEGADFARADLTGATLTKGNFSRCIFEGSDTTLIQVVAHEAIFKGANLAKAVLFQCQGQGADFSEANLEEAIVSKSVFDSNTRFDGAYVKGIRAAGATLQDEWLANAHRSSSPERGKFGHSAERVADHLLIRGIPNTDRAANDRALSKLNGLIGMEDVKLLYRQLADTIEADFERKKRGLPVNVSPHHFVFFGASGVGKTTLSKVTAEFLYSYGLVTDPTKVVEVTRGQLVADHIGGTAKLLRERFMEAVGGVFFIDEAYLLAGGSEKDFGHEAIGELLVLMEKYGSNTSVIVAGYRDLMKKFIESNPGLQSRFNIYVDLRDYSLEELGQIFRKRALTEAQFKAEPDVIAAIQQQLARMKELGGKNFGNARAVQNLFYEIKRIQSSRVMCTTRAGSEITQEQLQRITLQDLPDEGMLSALATLRAD